MMRRIITVWLFAAGCSRCGSNAEHQALPVADAGGPLAQMVAKVPVLDAGPPPPYVRQVKKYPPIPRQANVAQIFVGDNLSRMPWNPPKARKRSREEAKALAAKIAAEVRRGADFDQLAKRESDWPMAAHNGAALGVVTEGQGGMLPIIDPKVFTMPVGSVTDPFESQIGFHILKKLPMLRLAHILIAVRDGKNGMPPRTQDEARVLAKKTEEDLKAGKTFEQEAFDVSDDLATAGRGGDLGGMSEEHNGLPPPMRAAAKALHPGEVSEPIELPHGIEILKRLE